MYFECMFLYNYVIIIQVYVMYNVFVKQIKLKKKTKYLVTSFQDSPLPAVDTTRVKLHPMEGDDELPVTLSSTYPPSPPPSQDTSPMRSSPTPHVVKEHGKSADALVDTSDGVSPMGVRFSRTVERESADTTISELNARQKPIEVEGNLRTSAVHEHGSSESSSRELCGIILKRSDTWQYL